MKTTKEELIKLNERLEVKVKMLQSEDERMRTVFSELLDSTYYENDFYGSRKEKKTKVLSWEGIAFLMGELKADANYSCVIAGRDEFREENHILKTRIKELELGYEPTKQ